MKTQAIILAGGLGTRLRSAVPDLPKCMAPVAGKPFLHYLLTYLEQQGVTQFIFSLGYLHEMIEAYIETKFPHLNYQVSVESEPLGTGGAIQLACRKATENNVLVLNADTLFKINTEKLLAFHELNVSACTLSLKPMKNFDRYGAVEINKDGQIQSFREKQFYETGLINGGVYALNVKTFLQNNLPLKFSFEKDYLEACCTSLKMMALVQDEYFIDIGIPEDLQKANNEF